MSLLSEFWRMAILRRGKCKNIEHWWDLGYVLEREVRLQRQTGAWGQASSASQVGPALRSGIPLGLYFQKCLLFSKQFMHQGNVAETTR